MRQAARIADRAMDTVRTVARPGMSELELAGEAQYALMAAGSEQPASPISLAAGPRTAYCRALPTERRLSPGDSVRVEFGASRRRYLTMLGRQFVVGAPNARVRELYRIVREAADASIAAMAPGVPCATPRLAAKRVIVGAGLDAHRLPCAGDGLGIAFPPGGRADIRLSDDDQHALAAGTVMAVGPAVFLPGEGLGAQIVDSVLVTETGAELLSTFTRDLIEL